ncbi:MAG: MoaD family protein [Candidatus Bathyarchaeota archaeon]|jgi:molybdopterin synthase sulfur carrier subunit
MSVRFFAAMREIVGKRVEFLEFPQGEEVTVRRILQRLAKLYGEDFVEYVFDRKTGEVQDYLTLIVNGRSINTLDGLETEIIEGDVLALLPPIGGG